MNSFTLLDLDSQIDAAGRHTRGWNDEEFLQWLERAGSLIRDNNPSYRSTYLFISPVGIRTRFRFTENHELILVGFHSMYPTGFCFVPRKA